MANQKRLSEYWIEKKKELKFDDPSNRLNVQKWLLRTNIKHQMDQGNVSTSCYLSDTYPEQDIELLLNYLNAEEGLQAKLKFDKKQNKRYISVRWN